MFDISEKLIVGQSDQIFGVTPINWEDSPWRQLSLFNGEEIISLSHAKVYVFWDLCYVLERWISTQHQILFGKNSWVGSKIHHNTELWTQLMVSRWNSSGIFSQDSPHCRSSTKSKSSWADLWNADGNILRWRRKCLLLRSRSKAETKPIRPTCACSSTRTVPISERILTDIEPGTQSNQAYPAAKRLNTLLQHGQRPQEEDGTIEFWKLKDDLRNNIEYSHYWFDEMWKSKVAGGGGNKKIFSILYWLVRTRNSLSPSSPRSFRTQSHWYPSLQDNVLIPDIFFEYIYHIGCAISLHSVTNSGLIAGGQNSSRQRQTVFFTAVNLMNKEHKDPYKIDLTKPRLASYKQKKWNRHQDTAYWGGIQLAQRKRLKLNQTRCNAFIHYDTLPASCISKLLWWNLERSFTRKYMCHLDHHQRFP